MSQENVEIVRKALDVVFVFAVSQLTQAASPARR